MQIQLKWGKNTLSNSNNHPISHYSFFKLKVHDGLCAGITALIQVHKKGKDVIMRKCDCLSSQTAIFTYRALFEKTFTEEMKAGLAEHFMFSIYDEVRLRLHVPHEKVGRIDLGRMIKRGMLELGISAIDLSKGLGTDGARIQNIIDGQIPASIDIIEQILWLLKIEIQ